MLAQNPRWKRPWPLKIPLILTVGILIGFYLYWFTGSIGDQWMRQANSAAHALDYFVSRDDRAYHEWSCQLDESGQVILQNESEAFEWTIELKRLQFEDSEEGRNFRNSFRQQGLSELNVPTQSCRRWSDILEAFQSVQSSSSSSQKSSEPNFK